LEDKGANLKRDFIFYGVLILIIISTFAHGYYVRIKSQEQLNTILKLRETIQELELDLKNKKPLMVNHRQLSERVLKLKNALAQGKSLDEPKKKSAHIPFADE
jgi:hypothetical protein